MCKLDHNPLWNQNYIVSSHTAWLFYWLLSTFVLSVNALWYSWEAHIFFERSVLCANRFFSFGFPPTPALKDQKMGITLIIQYCTSITIFGMCGYKLDHKLPVQLESWKDYGRKVFYKLLCLTSQFYDLMEKHTFDLKYQLCVHIDFKLFESLPPFLWKTKNWLEYYNFVVKVLFYVLETERQTVTWRVWTQHLLHTFVLYITALWYSGETSTLYETSSLEANCFLSSPAFPLLQWMRVWQCLGCVETDWTI